MLILNLPLVTETGSELVLEMAEDQMVMVVVVDLMVMEEVMAVGLKDQLDHLVLVEDRAMADEARVDQEDQEDRQEVWEEWEG